MAKALERFGTLRWQDVMAPAIALARRGMELDWYMQVMIANGAEHLSRFRRRAPPTCPMRAACRRSIGKPMCATSSSAISVRPTSG